MNAVARPWMSARASAMRLGITVYELYKLAVAGKVRTLAQPGQTVKFNVADIERIAAEQDVAASA